MRILRLLLAFVLSCFSVGLYANHVLGGNITYECLGGNTYEITLTYYADCFGATTPAPEENIFFFPTVSGCANAFSVPFQFVSQTEISDLCASELTNSSCQSGFLPGTNAVVYSAVVDLDVSCVWDVAWETADWNYFINMDNSMLPTAYLGTLIDPSQGCSQSVVIEPFVPYYCTGDVVAYTPTISNPAGYTLQYSFTDVLTTSGVPAPWEVGFSGAAPIPGAAIDPATGEITFTAPNQFGNYVVGVQIDMFDGGGNLVGTVLESLTFTIRLCDNSVTAFTAPGVLSAHSDVTVISGTHLEVCAGDSLCFTVEAANANPFRSITLTDDFLDAANFPDGEVVSNGTNPVQAEYCTLVPNDATGSFTITIDAMDDACVMPTSDQLVITVDISTTLFTSVLDTVICAGEMLPLLVNGDSDYTWNLVSGTVEAPGFVGTGGTQNITPLSPLEIEVIANNAPAACNWRDTILVDVSMYALPGIVIDETCNGNDGQIDLEVFGGDGPYQYSWFPGGAITQDISSLTGGTYTVTVIDQSMVPTCMRDTTFTVGSAPPPSGSISGDATICEGDCTDITFTLAGTAPFNVTLMNLTTGVPEVVPAVVDQDVFQVCPATTTVYELQAVTGSNVPSCTDNTTSQVTVTVKPTVTASFIDPGTLCEGEAINLEIDIDQPGTFDVDYIDADGNNQSMAVADGATIPVTVDDPTTTLSVESVAYQTAPLCANTNQALLNIDVDPLPTAVISGGTTICAGENVVLHFDLTGTGPWDVTYTENNGAPMVMNILFNSFDWIIAGGPAATTNYCITNVLDLGTNCDQDVNSCAEVVVNTLPTGSLAADATICAGETEALEFTLNGNGPFNVTLEDGVGNDMGVPVGQINGDTFDVTPVSTETYCLTQIVDANSCTTTLNSCVDITVNPLPTVDITGNTIICDGLCYDLAIGNMTGNAPWNVDWELRNASDDSVIDSGTEIAMINGDVIQFCPNEDAYVVITSITDSSVPACATATPAGQFDIQVNTYTTVSVSQDSTICLGGSPLLTFCFSDYDAGDTFSLDIDNASSFNLPAGSLGADGCYNFAPSIDPVISTTYSILTFTNDNNICTQIDNADVSIQVTEVPTATLDLDQTICPGTDATLTVNIPTAGGPFDIQVEEGSSGDILTFEDIADQFTFAVSPAANDSYELIYIADSTTAAACNSAPASLVNITLFDAPAPVLPMDTLCTDTGEEFQIAFEIAGGDPLTYSVNPTLGSDVGGVLSAGPPYIYTSGVMTAGDEETWEISDASGCTPYQLDINTFDCPVLTYSGTIDLTAQVFCSDGLVCATANGDEFLDGNDVLSFLIISDADFNSAVVYYISAGNCWDVDVDLDMVGTLTYGTEYYLVAVAGNDQGNGLVDLGNPNISVSEAMPFTILDTPTATISGDATICAGQTTTLTVDLTGTPEWNFEILQDGISVGMAVADQATTPYTVDVSNAGVYTIGAIDNTGCVGATNGSATITVNPLPTADLTADGEICDGDTWDFDVALTGTANWDVVIAYDDGVNGPVDINLNGLTNTASQYTTGNEGTYTITSVTDGNGCVNTATGVPVTLIVNDLPSAQWAFADSSYCEGADIDLDYLVTGAFPVDITYQLDGANDVVITTAADGSETVNTPGQYCITLVEDDNGCSVTPNLCINISEIVAPIADAGLDVVVCSSVDQIIGTPGDPALDYEWGGDVSIIVGDNTTPEITINGFNNTPGSDVYILTLTASDTDCSTTDDIQVTIIPEPVPNAGQDEEICYDEETQLDASGGADYLWEDNGWFNSNLDIDNPLVQPLETDTFVVTVFGLNGCGAMDSVILFVPEPFDIVTDNTPEVCFEVCDAFIDVTPGGSYGTYAIAWDSPALDDFSETDVCAGLYNYTIFDENFCSITGTVEILELAEPFIDDVLINTPNCFGDETGQLTVVEPTAAQFYLDYPVDSNATGVFSNLPAGNYSLMVLDVDGCYSDTLVSFSENSSQMFISTNFDTTLICVDTPIEFIANAAGGSGVLTYTWYDDLPPAGSQIQTGDTYTVIPQDTTVVYVLATDELGCTTDTLMMAAVFDTPVDVYTDPNGEPQICQGECLDMTAFPSGGNGNVQVTWVQYDQFNPVDLGNDLSITECPMEGTAYIVYADDGCSVVATDTVFVIVHETPDVEFEVNSYGECYPFTATFVNLTDTLLWGNCLWDFGNGDLQAVCDTISFTYFNPGTYNPTLTVTSEFGCTDTDSLDVPIFAYDYPVANFTWSPDPVSTLENHVQFINESIGAQTYFWDLSGFTQTTLVDPVFEFPVVDQISYIVCLEAINEFGCRDTICKDLLMESIMTVNVPNAFTPDSDGLNDTFFPVISGITDENYTFRIWDRWGAIVFETHDRTDVWTGGVGNGDDPGNYYVPNDVYIWEVECEELSTGEIHNFKGHVTIVR